jgi:hypothetical protein
MPILFSTSTVPQAALMATYFAGNLPGLNPMIRTKIPGKSHKKANFRNSPGPANVNGNATLAGSQ